MSNKNKSIIIKVFKIVQISSGDLIRSFELEDLPEGNKRSIFDVFDDDDVMVFFQSEEGFSADKIVNGFFKKQIEKLCKEGYLSPQYLSDDVLAESVFYFLDTLSLHCSCIADKTGGAQFYKCNNVTIETIDSLWTAMRDSGLHYYRDLGIDIFSNPEMTLIIDPLRRGESILEKYLTKALDEPIDVLPCNIEMRGDFPYGYIESVIKELVDRDIHNVHRLWHTPEIDSATDEFREWGSQPQIPIWYTLNTHLKECESLIQKTQGAYRFAIKMLTKDSRSLFEQLGDYVFYLSRTREPNVSILHKPGDRFCTSFTYQDFPNAPFDSGADSYSRQYSHLDFRRAPLYSMLEYFFLRNVCKSLDIHCVMCVGDHIGRQFR